VGASDFNKRQTTLSFVLLAPAATAVIVLLVYPLYRVVDISVRDGRTMNFAKISELPLGWGNYAKVLSDDQFWHSVLNSALYVGGSVSAAFLIGLCTALLLNEKLPGTRIWRTIILVPWAVPGVIVSIVFLWMLDGSFGVVNSILRNLGLPVGNHPWFVDRNTALISAMMPTIWKAYPLITLTLLAALQSIPRELYEATAVDGANRFQNFVYITWPSVRGAGLLVVMITALGIFRDVDIIYATTGGGPARATETLSLYLYNEAFEFFRMGTAAAVGVIMIVIAAVIAASLMLWQRRSSF